MPSSLEENKPFLLKNIYTVELLTGFADNVQKQWHAFSVKKFLQHVFDNSWQSRELKDRTRHISTGLKINLPATYQDALPILLDTVDTYVEARGEAMAFEYGFIPDFVENFGVQHPDLSIPALAGITRLTSAEFAVRPYLLNYPERMYAQMLIWSQHESYCVRRLSSEGFRPRLPWGMGIPVLKKDPSPILPVLENLKADPSETVRRSVANNLNDISKDHPALVLQIAGNWLHKNPETDWVVRHACRGLLKQGHPVALGLFGFDSSRVQTVLQSFTCDPKVKVGEHLAFALLLKNMGTTTEKIRLEYAIEYITSSGKTSRKVFKIKEFELAAGQSEAFNRRQSFKNFTTRKHYPGKHKIVALINGKEAKALEFEVVA